MRRKSRVSGFSEGKESVVIRKGMVKAFSVLREATDPALSSQKKKNLRTICCQSLYKGFKPAQKSTSVSEVFFFLK